MESGDSLNVIDSQVVKVEAEQNIENRTIIFSFGVWSKEEQEKYIIFLQNFKKHLQCRNKRKQLKIFKLMAQFIGTRTGVQCRSHHMKQLRTHKKLRMIVSVYKKNSEPENSDLKHQEMMIQENSSQNKKSECLRAPVLPIRYINHKESQIGDSNIVSPLKTEDEVLCENNHQIMLLWPLLAYQYYMPFSWN